MYKILIVEDVEAVADLQVLKLIRAGVAVETRRVAGCRRYGLA